MGVSIIYASTHYQIWIFNDDQIFWERYSSPASFSEFYRGRVKSYCLFHFSTEECLWSYWPIATTEGWNKPIYILDRCLSHKVHHLHWATILRFLATFLFCQRYRDISVLLTGGSLRHQQFHYFWCIFTKYLRS